MPGLSSADATVTSTEDVCAPEPNDDGNVADTTELRSDEGDSQTSSANELLATNATNQTTSESAENWVQELSAQQKQSLHFLVKTITPARWTEIASRLKHFYQQDRTCPQVIYHHCIYIYIC